ncbi:hypothetical protein [Bernardetia sp.]|uniref:hypothetical protein n=1 Tax=Bernardetia sp. TaxID=1937974 RepID=UPI0025BFAB65|nr:hypothetical protein [Bernardetia sp.]
MSEQTGRPRKDLSSAPHSISGKRQAEQRKKVRFQDDHFSRFHGYNEQFISDYKEKQSKKISLGIWVRVALFVLILLILFFNIFGNTLFAQTSQDTVISLAPPINKPIEFDVPKRYSTEKADFDILVQELFPVQEEDIDYSDLYESLFQFFIQPLDLNKANRNDLISTFLLSETQIEDFLNHRERYGKLLSIYEIQSIPSWDEMTIERIVPFVTVTESTIQQDTRSLFQRILAEKNKTLLIRYSRVLEEQRGYTTDTTGATRYLGSPNRVYTRMRISHLNDFSLGFTLEKDAGEQFIWDTETKRYGFDFMSAHLVVHNQGKFKTIALGDYQLQFGQGLIFGAGFAAGKGSETINTTRRSTQGVRPYTSVLETNFQRGAAATYNIGQFDITGFYSRVGEDGGASRLALDTLNDGQESDLISSLIATGFHRTPSEIEKKDNFIRTDAGGNITYKDKQNNLELGATVSYTAYDKTLQRNDRLYNRFEFNGKNNYNFGINYSYSWRNMSFFGEAARSKSGGMGLISGVMFSLARPLEMAMLYRNYDRDFHTFYGAAFGEGSRPINERGFYWGIKYKPSKKWQLTAYYDRFRFPWMRFLVDAPSGGHEYLARLTYRPSRSIQLYGQFRQEVREKNYRNEDDDNVSNFNTVRPYTRRNYQLNCDYKAEEIVSLRARVQFSSYEHVTNPTQGYVIVQDVNLDFGKVRFSTRFALFDTDDYENRQYVYEKDVLYYFFIPAYYGRGFRNFYMVQLKAGKKIDIWAKWAYTKYRDQETIGSGLEQINGDLRNDIRIQMRLKF